MVGCLSLHIAERSYQWIEESGEENSIQTEDDLQVIGTEYDETENRGLGLIVVDPRDLEVDLAVALVIGRGSHSDTAGNPFNNSRIEVWE